MTTDETINFRRDYGGEDNERYHKDPGLVSVESKLLCRPRTGTREVVTEIYRVKISKTSPVPDRFFY